MVGENMHYSQSPRIFEAMFKQIGLEGCFDLHSVSREQLGECVKQLVVEKLDGFSVTIPHKQAVMEYLHEMDPVAASLGAVNSVAIKKGRLIGYNTDCYGVTHALQRKLVALGEGPALIYGSGGAARAVVHALYHDFGIRKLTICGRSHAGPQALEQDLKQSMSAIDITTCSDADIQDRLDINPTIVINCTPLGGANHPDKIPFATGRDWSGLKCYFDLNYNDDNRAISLMRDLAVPVVDGSAMLAAQAVKSFELWTGRPVEFEPVYHEVFGPDG